MFLIKIKFISNYKTNNFYIYFAKISNVNFKNKILFFNLCLSLIRSTYFKLKDLQF